MVGETRNILLIGRTGSGKSALANVLINKDGKFEEVFKEGNYSTSETGDIQVEQFQLEEKKYKIIDTVGIDDTNLEHSKVFYTIVKGCRVAKKWFNQVLFVGCEKFTQQEVNAYNVLIDLFGKEITNYITIVRTKFPNFEDEDECRKDIELLTDKDNEKITEMINSCGKRIVHVDNPSVSISGDSMRVKKQISINKEIRLESRNILLKHLETCQGTYKPEKLDEINKRIDEYVEKEDKRLNEELKIVIKD